MPDPSQTRSTVALEDFFTGRLQGWGVTIGRLGGLRNRFTLQAEGAWNPQRRILSLKETYVFDDGHIDELDWRIIKDSDNRYEGFEDRIFGSARGLQDFAEFRWKYRRAVTRRNGSPMRLGFDDRFFFHDRDHMTAYASLTKFGFEVATLHAFYERSG